MTISLRVRLLLAFMLVLGVALGGMSIIASRSTSTEFRGYVERRTETDFRRLIGGLSRHYAENQGWDGVQAFVERGAQFSSDRVLVADLSGTIVADSEGSMIGEPARDLPRGAPIIVWDTHVGTAFVTPGAAPEPGATFLSSINRSLLLSAGAAAVLALVLTLVLSRRIVGPVEDLTRAVRKMEQGDLSARVQMLSRDEVGELSRAFNSMARGLARTEQLRKNMVTDVAHELRTPLSNVRGYLEAMRDGVLPADAKTIESVYEEALHLSRLVEDLQELALAEAGQLKLDRSATDLEEVVDQAIRAEFPSARARGLALDVEVDDGLPPVDADARRIGQVLRNLIGNAIAHTPAGGTVTVCARKDGGLVQVAVSDTGEGIPAEHLPHIFDRFYRVDPSRARSTGGSGIGLAIVKHLVGAHGGAAWAESAIGKGSVFKFTLPVTATQDSPPGAQPAAESAPVSPETA